jgi:hypothetical protein
MIGTKKLSTIRKEIETALASTGADPIQRLERQIASVKRRRQRRGDRGPQAVPRIAPEKPQAARRGENAREARQNERLKRT